MNTSCGGLHLSENKEELKGTEKNLKELNLSQYSCLRYNKENLREPIRTENL